MRINFCSNQSCQGLLSKSGGVIFSFSALFFAGVFRVNASNVCSCLPILYLMQRIAWPAPVLVEALTKCPLTQRNMNSLLCVQIPRNLESIAAFVAVSAALGPMQQQDHQVSVVIHCGVARAWHSPGGRDVQL